MYLRLLKSKFKANEVLSSDIFASLNDLVDFDDLSLEEDDTPQKTTNEIYNNTDGEEDSIDLDLDFEEESVKTSSVFKRD